MRRAGPRYPVRDREMLTCWTSSRYPTFRDRCLVSNITTTGRGSILRWSDAFAAASSSRSFEVAVCVNLSRCVRSFEVWR
jgi:hypothetical protein